MIRVVLADDHILVRGGIRALLHTLSDIEVVAEADDGHEALRMIAAHQPDVALLDIGMTGLNGLEVTARVTKGFPQVRVIILSMHADVTSVAQAVRSGAVGYLVKGARVAELEIAVRSVAQGAMYLSPTVTKLVVTGYSQQMDGEAGAFDRLTPRQREIVQLIAEGRTTKAIAEALHLSVKTVENYRAQAMERLDIHDVVGLIRYALRMGLVPPDEYL